MIVTLKEMKRIRQEAKRKGQRVVMTNGCFDLLHVGHLRCFKMAKALGDMLIVGVNSDRSVRKLKGKERPVFKAKDRVAMLDALQSVDYVFIFLEDTPKKWLREIKPDILAKGGDDEKSTKDYIVGKEIVEGYGGKVVLLPYIKGRSTTNIINKLKGVRNE